MSNKDEIIWIDDDVDRKDDAEEVNALFIDVRTSEGEIEKKLNDLLLDEEPRLIVIDHYLNDTSARVFQHGSTIAEAVKGNWPTCPVVGVTNAHIAGINERSRLAYDDLFDSTVFGKWKDEIESIAAGFDEVESAASDEPKSFLALLDAPVSNIDSLYEAFPEVLKKTPRDPSYPSAFYRWIKHLMNRPGFLYDNLWTATFLGLSETGLEKFRGHFEEALYTGVFQREIQPRWWADSLSELLYRHVQPISGKFTWHAVRGMDGLSPEDTSRCYSCDKDFPETVAFLDSSTLDRRAMHLECTGLDPRYKRELYFEDMRILVEGVE